MSYKIQLKEGETLDLKMEYADRIPFFREMIEDD